MNESPERIWAYHPVNSQCAVYRPAARSTEYIRADLVTPPQITDAMVEAALDVWMANHMRPTDAMRATLTAALASTPVDTSGG